MKKTFVLDTSAILHAPDVLKSFDDNDIIIPFIVLEELDKFKKNDDEVGKNCRSAIRYLDELRSSGSLQKGVSLDNGGKLTVEDIKKNSGGFDLTINDNIILNTVCAFPGSILVTNDINLRVKSDACGIPSEPFGKKKSQVSDEYMGICTVNAERETINLFKQQGWLPFEDEDVREYGVFPNEYVLLFDPESRKEAIARYDDQKKRIVKLINPENNSVFNIYPKSNEQKMAIDALLNNDISLVTINGKAGSGKTLVALASALEQILNQPIYKKLLVARPIMPMGKDIGFLPGDLGEKLNPWMQPIEDNLEFLFDLNKRHDHTPKKKKKNKQQDSSEQEETSTNSKLLEKLKSDGILQVEALTYIRGRSIPNQFIIIDEAQNLTPHEVKTIITRAGEGTKIVLTGDIEQIDSAYLDEQSNGLAYCVNRMKHLPISAHIKLLQCERSPLAEAGSECL